jgi:predicted glycosyltransferase
MSSEAAVLGVPAVMIPTTGRGYTDEQERRYGHARHFVEDDYDQAVAAVEELFAWNPASAGSRRANGCSRTRST